MIKNKKQPFRETYRELATQGKFTNNLDIPRQHHPRIVPEFFSKNRIYQTRPTFVNPQPTHYQKVGKYQNARGSTWIDQRFAPNCLKSSKPQFNDYRPEKKAVRPYFDPYPSSHNNCSYFQNNYQFAERAVQNPEIRHRWPAPGNKFYQTKILPRQYRPATEADQKCQVCEQRKGLKFKKDDGSRPSLISAECFDPNNTDRWLQHHRKDYGSREDLRQLVTDRPRRSEFQKTSFNHKERLCKQTRQDYDQRKGVGGNLFADRVQQKIGRNQFKPNIRYAEQVRPNYQPKKQCRVDSQDNKASTAQAFFCRPNKQLQMKNLQVERPDHQRGSAQNKQFDSKSGLQFFQLCEKWKNKDRQLETERNKESVRLGQDRLNSVECKAREPLRLNTERSADCVPRKLERGPSHSSSDKSIEESCRKIEEVKNRLKKLTEKRSKERSVTYFYKEQCQLQNKKELPSEKELESNSQGGRSPRLPSANADEPQRQQRKRLTILLEKDIEESENERVEGGRDQSILQKLKDKIRSLSGVDPENRKSLLRLLDMVGD